MRIPLAASLAFAVALLPAAASAQKSFPPIPRPDQVRLAEAFRLDRLVADRIWPGWHQVPFAVLLITDSVEYLVRHPAPTPDFVSLGYDSLLGANVRARRRIFPTRLLATAPFVGGVNTIAVGTAEATGKSSVEWVLTLMHEHFHQLQYSRPGYYAGVAGLDLARGDTTGMWMLNYPFPYDSAPVSAALEHLAAALDRAVGAPPGKDDPGRLLTAALLARDSVRDVVSARDDRYLEFQLWQEGIARYTEYAVALAAEQAGGPSAEFRALPDYQDYAAAAAGQLARLHAELADERPAVSRRVIVYSLGAALALAMDRAGRDWKTGYFQAPFVLNQGVWRR